MSWAAGALGLALPLLGYAIGWRLGLRRLLLRLLRGLLAGAVASSVLLLGLRSAWPAALLWPGCLLLAFVWWRLSGRWLGRFRRPAAGHPTCPIQRGLALRLAGALVGLSAGLLGNLVLGLLLAGWGRTVPAPTPAVDSTTARQHNAQAFASLASAGAELADWTNRRLVAHLPGGRSWSVEVAATLRLIQAEPAALEVLATEHELLALVQRPAVAAALDDPAYLAAIDELGHGALWRLPMIVEHPLTRRLLADDELRTRLRSLRPSQLAAGLPASATAVEASEAGPDQPDRSDAAGIGEQIAALGEAGWQELLDRLDSGAVDEDRHGEPTGRATTQGQTPGEQQIAEGQGVLDLVPPARQQGDRLRPQGQVGDSQGDGDGMAEQPSTAGLAQHGGSHASEMAARQDGG